jgi:hypothetical protein
MLWCPKCKTEFREGFNICSDCAVELVECLNEDKKQYDIYKDDEWCLLLKIQNEREADIVEALIHSKQVK